MPLRHVLLAVVIAFLWGGNFIASKFGLRHFEPFLFSSVRFMVVGLLLLPFVPWPRRRDWKMLVLLSVVMGTGNIGFAILGFKYGLDIATTILTIQLGTPFACALGAVLMKDRLGPWRTLGLIVAFSGILVVVGTPKVSGNMLGFWLVLFSAFMFGLTNILMKRLPAMPILQILCWMSLLSAPQTWLLSLLTEVGQWEAVKGMNWDAAGAIGYSAVISTILAYGGWYWLMARHPVTRVAPFALLVPIFGIAMGQAFFQEELTLRTLIGGTVTLLGVAIIVLRRPRMAEMGN